MKATSSTCARPNTDKINVSTWEECEAEVTKIEKAYATSHTKLLFRGQRDSVWPLDTTLERRIPAGISVNNYYDMISRVMPVTSTYFDASWVMPSSDEINAWCKDYNEFTLANLPAYDYLAYLRHHGFPSPLLDWSRSLYVAAYFAFANTVSSEVAIFVFLEQPDNTKHSSSSAPQIHIFGPYVKTHPRHFRQQSRYTVCAKFESDTAEFRPHQSVFEPGRTDQDLLWKFVVPANERLKVLSRLDEYNLNAFSLFDSEESLMETLAFREIDLKGLPP